MVTGIILTIGVLFVTGGILYRLGYRLKNVNYVELSDVLKKPAEKRSDVQIDNDAVMRLKNEIANSGAIKKMPLENGDIHVSIKVVV